MDPVQKAVLHHTLGLPPTAKRKHVSCSVCQLRFNSQVSKFSSEEERKLKSHNRDSHGKNTGHGSVCWGRTLKYGGLLQEEISENLSDGRMLNCVQIFLLP